MVGRRLGSRFPGRRRAVSKRVTSEGVVSAESRAGGGARRNSRGGHRLSDSFERLVMAFHGPSYGLSRECQMKSQAKFSLDRAREAVDWVERVLDEPVDYPSPDEGLRDQHDFGAVLKNGTVLCKLINILHPGAVKKINTMSAPFKQRENIEMFLKGCESYGLKPQDLFQVNDLYENKNLYMVVDCLYALGGVAQKKGFNGPALGVKVADENKRHFSEDVLRKGEQVIGLQYGSNQGANQSGMTAYGAGRQILPNGR